MQINAKVMQCNANVMQWMKCKGNAMKYNIMQSQVYTKVHKWVTPRKPWMPEFFIFF